MIFLLLALFLNRFRSLRSEYLDISNLLLLIVAVSVAIITAIGYYKKYAEATQNNLSFSDNSSHYYTIIFLTGIVPLVFLFKRLRRKIATTLVVAACVNWFVFYEQVYIWITSFYRDYLPSSWSVSYESSPTPYVVTSTIAHFLFAFMFANKRKAKA
jgi:molybdopterin-containing oxidoreductase family membrane subunit